MVKIAQLASLAGPQSRVAQPETPVTLQFQGNKFTLSHSQLRQLTAGQPLQLQGEGQPPPGTAECTPTGPGLAGAQAPCVDGCGASSLWALWAPAGWPQSTCLPGAGALSPTLGFFLG